jgi:2-oxoglutarate dehydrogenase E2 component (dihydrolipoamide succinyltransferase)
MAVEVRIPQLGESVTEGVIVRWLKRDGTPVEADEPVLELETDKATMEIPAPASGQLEILEREGATVAVGAVVGRIAEATAPADADERPGPRARQPAGTAAEGIPATDVEAGVPLGPAVRRLVAEHRLDPSLISGTGKGGRLTKEDVLRHVERAAPRPPPSAAAPPVPDEGAREAAPETPPAPRPSLGAERPAADVERKPMSPLGRRLAERLVEAQRSAAILTTFNEIDLSRLLAARTRHRERFRERHGVDLGLMSLFGRACVLALADVPVVNARIDGDDIVYHRHVHLGIAVSTSRGLVVPVVRHAERKSLAELERVIGELAGLAREGKLTPDHLAGGTFTITNGGVFGSLLSTPILNPPQSGILGMHKIEQRPVAVEGQVVIRPMMYVALSYDHRLVDGEQAVTFLVRVKERLEDPVRMLFEV